MKFLLFVICALATAYPFCSAWRDRHNTLELYSELESAKAELALGVNGAQSFLVTPVTLAGRALNLAAWHGNQEVAVRETWDRFPRVRVRLRALGEAELTVLAYPAGEGPALGFRLSNRPGQPSALLELNGERRFLSRRPLTTELLPRLAQEVELLPEEQNLSFRVDGIEIGRRPLPPGAWRIAFRGDSTEGVARIDDVRLEAPGKVYWQAFAGRFPYFLFFASSFLLVIFFVLLDLALRGNSAAGVAMSVAAFSGLVGWAWENRVSVRYPNEVPALHGRASRIPTTDEALAALRQLPEPAPDRATVLWLGGSQAWGAGASRAEHSTFERVRRALPEGFGQRFELVNGAISGATVAEQAHAFDAVAARRRVAAVLLVASVNDAMNERFPKDLAAFASHVRAQGAALWLVPEPVRGTPAPSVHQRQEQVLAFSREAALPLVPLQGLLDRSRDEGFLWWDFVHLTDAGAEIAARAIAPFVIEQLSKLPRSAPAATQQRAQQRKGQR